MPTLLGDRQTVGDRLSSVVRIMSDLSVFVGGLTDMCPPVLIDLLLAFVSKLLDTGVIRGCAVFSGVMHGDDKTVDSDRSRRDGGGRLDDISM